jgi:hypothetical protein
MPTPAEFAAIAEQAAGKGRVSTSSMSIDRWTLRRRVLEALRLTMPDGSLMPLSGESYRVYARRAAEWAATRASASAVATPTQPPGSPRRR